MNLRIHFASEKRNSRNKVAQYLHQCKQCGVLFEHIEKAIEFSWERMFMADKCEVCKNFRDQTPAKGGIE
jgi:hypothetical protein